MPWQLMTVLIPEGYSTPLDCLPQAQCSRAFAGSRGARETTGPAVAVALSPSDQSAMHGEMQTTRGYKKPRISKAPKSP
ncbi:hypothetical protein C4K35_2345 [Pseudomonas chlororaphis subsp. piscium]|nr:hypothetical protein C4K35_2345 [Pseudomonas chlororaphis subsp. piscium]AZC56507.1 hypothetical protein C4K34_2342 [Pseudomonas chlororaphis subsp. piscium]AZC68961.1 hypothetical protein C4K32_2299 [Pseudomonas chlororaphis subsp. piscium]AZC75145.1 hypothetical protein C4K31_2242 [Pseudomonas chlororaphis subsp. piscium]AZC81412.1 hypothetical protein C4K30_2298 [Pseudomonas chlororaphis subsp. piscium]